MSKPINNVVDVSITKAVDIIQLFPPDIKVMLWGPPGIGKTKTLQSVFENAGLTVIPVLAGQSEPTDIQGLPFPYENKYAKYMIPWWAWYASDDPDVPEEYQGPMLLFFDDVVTAHEQTQAALYKLIDEGYLGELRLRNNVRIVAAGNSVDDMSAVVDMPKALCNRFVHLYIRPNAQAWIEWAASNGIHPHVVYFIRKNERYITTFDDVRDSTETHAWATPRTWEMLSKILFALEEAECREVQLEDMPDSSYKVNHEDIEFITTQACIGKLAIEFLTQTKQNFYSVSLKDIFGSPKTAEVPKMKEVDRLFATVSNIEYNISQPNNHKNLKPACVYASRLPAEFSLMLTRTIATIGSQHPVEGVAGEIIGSDEFSELQSKWENDLDRLF